MVTIKATPWNDPVLGGKTVELFFDEQNSEVLSAQLESTLLDLNMSGVVFAQVRTDYCLERRVVLEKLGFRFIDISYELKFNQPLRQAVNWRMPTGIELCTDYSESELDFAKKMAYEDFKFGRLLEDPRIIQSFSRARTGRWIDLLLKEPYSFYLAKYKGAPIGFHAELKHSDHVEWILTGVSSQYSMLALMLWQEAFLLAQTNCCKSITTVVSALNYGVMNIYSSFPFRINNAWCGYHWHNNI
ncbi:hypothetical protein [Neptunicella sp.]|uniref:hypothetical protein n=1 Tax=Neptunicella sp. TaxID=2125986 RepID=UPI003F694B7C